MMTITELDALDGVTHGFYTRDGGVSGGLYDSLNCGFGSNDRPENVAANRARAMARLGLGGEALATAYQVHGVAVRVVGRGDAADAARIEADALVTRETGVALGILTADCAPVLFADREESVIGAAHAGWRGALAGVLEATVAAMERIGARRQTTVAAIGPCIGRDSYEVGPEFPAPFLADDSGNDRFFTPAARAGHFMFDLEGYVARRLGAMGLGVVAAAGRDTCTEEDYFFSYRRATLRGEDDFGRGLSAIALGN